MCKVLFGQKGGLFNVFIKLRCLGYWYSVLMFVCIENDFTKQFRSPLRGCSDMLFFVLVTNIFARAFGAVARYFLCADKESTQRKLPRACQPFVAFGCTQGRCDIRHPVSYHRLGFPASPLWAPHAFSQKPLTAISWGSPFSYKREVMPLRLSIPTHWIKPHAVATGER